MTTAKKQTEENISTLVQNNDGVLYWALMELYNLQTTSEQKTMSTRVRNRVGFNALDANFMSSLARYYLSHGYLTFNQKIVARRKMIKYTKQLTRIANKEI